MSDYRVTVRVQNNNILSMIQKRGYPSPLSLCNQTGFSYQSLSKLINLRSMPLGHNGSLKPTVRNLCFVLKCVPEELFSDAQLETELESNKRAVEVKEAEMRFMLGSKCESKLLEQSIMDERLPLAIENALDTLTPREKKVINMRFGVGESSRNHTLDEIASNLGVGRERARQIEAKALGKLRHPSASRPLREYL